MVASGTVHKFSLSGAAMAAALTSAPATAQAEGDAPVVDQGGLGAIVVTAQRREENVQDIPIAISSFSPDDLQSRGSATRSNSANSSPT